MVSEHDRAVEYRRQEEARVAAKLAREKALKGNDAYFQQLVANFEPLQNWSGWDPPVSIVGDEK